MVITLSVIIWWILIGLVVGAVARLVIPGRQHIGILVTILIGIVAAIVGGILTAALLGAGHTRDHVHRRRAARGARRQRVQHARLRPVPHPQPPSAGLASLVASR